MDIHTLGAGACPQSGPLAKLTTPCPSRRKRKETSTLTPHPEESTLGWNPSRKVLIASPPPTSLGFRVKGFPPYTSCNLSVVT